VCYSEIIFYILHSIWTLVLQLEWIVYTNNYLEVISQQVDTCIAASLKRVRVNIIWNLFHSSWTLLLQLEWSALQWTLYGRYFTSGGHCYCSLNGVRYSEHYMEDTSQQMELVWQLELILLQGRLCWTTSILFNTNMLWNFLFILSTYIYILNNTFFFR
jgi:hypothetical protein